MVLVEVEVASPTEDFEGGSVREAGEWPAGRTEVRSLETVTPNSGETKGQEERPTFEENERLCLVVRKVLGERDWKNPGRTLRSAGDEDAGARGVAGAL